MLYTQHTHTFLFLFHPKYKKRMENTRLLLLISMNVDADAYGVAFKPAQCKHFTVYFTAWERVCHELYIVVTHTIRYRRFTVCAESIGENISQTHSHNATNEQRNGFSILNKSIYDYRCVRFFPCLLFLKFFLFFYGQRQESNNSKTIIYSVRFPQ